MVDLRFPRRAAVGSGSRYPQHQLRPPRATVPEDDAFDDELGIDALEDEMPELRDMLERAKPLIDPVVNEVLPAGVIDISQEVGCLLAREQAFPRFHHHFAEADVGYRYISGDTVKLRVRPREHALYGAFTGRIMFREDVARVPGAHPSYRVYDIDGVLRYRLSASWVIGVLVFFGLLLWWTKPGWPAGLTIFALGAGITLWSTYRLGRDQRDDVADRLAESFLRLRATIHNRR